AGHPCGEPAAGICSMSCRFMTGRIGSLTAQSVQDVISQESESRLWIVVKSVAADGLLAEKDSLGGAAQDRPFIGLRQELRSVADQRNRGSVGMLILDLIWT